MSSEAEGILSDAVARNLATVLSLPSAGMLRHHKSRFLAECDEGVWIESAPQDNLLIDDLIGRQHPAAISFKLGPAKASFAAVPIRRDPQLRINTNTVVDALLLRWPDEIKTVQRRSNYRVRITADCELRARAWRIAEAADVAVQPSEHQEITVELRDLSNGGMGLTVVPDAEKSVTLCADERLRIELRYADQTLLIEGRVRHLPANPRTGGTKTGGSKTGNGPMRTGIQFKKLENDLEGRQSLAVLTRIVGQLQRDEVRRLRLGLTKVD